MANPRKFSEKIALHNQKQAEETAAFEKIMREVSDATNKPEETTLATQYGIGGGGRSGAASPSRNTGQRGRASTSVGPMRRPSERKHDTSPYGSTVYLSPPPDSSWRRTNSDSALHQSCAGGAGSVDAQQTTPSLSPHHLMHSHGHQHQNHRRDIYLDTISPLGSNTNRPRSSCEMPRIPNNNVYEVGGGGGGGTLMCGELQVPGGSLPDLTSVHFPSQPHTYPVHPHRTSPDYHHQNHLSVPNTNNYLHHNKNMSPLDHSWITSSYQSHCSPPSQYSSTSNINIPSPTMVHSPGSPAESPQTDYNNINNIHQTLLQPFEQITMLDAPPTNNYTASYMNHNSPHSPHSPQTTNSPFCQSPHRSVNSNGPTMGHQRQDCCNEVRNDRDPVPGGHVFPSLTSPTTAIPDIILTDYSGELDANIFGGEEAQLRAGLDLDDLNLLEEPSSLLPDSSVEHEFRLDRL